MILQCNISASNWSCCRYCKPSSWRWCWYRTCTRLDRPCACKANGRHRSGGLHGTAPRTNRRAPFRRWRSCWPAGWPADPLGSRHDESRARCIMCRSATYLPSQIDNTAKSATTKVCGLLHPISKGLLAPLSCHAGAANFAGLMGPVPRLRDAGPLLAPTKGGIPDATGATGPVWPAVCPSRPRRC